MVTPDAEKTMCTSLGVGDLLAPDDVDIAVIGAARVVYLEGYLSGWSTPTVTVEVALAAARPVTTVALSLSDPLWVQLHGEDMAGCSTGCRLLFANEQEACLHGRG